MVLAVAVLVGTSTRYRDWAGLQGGVEVVSVGMHRGSEYSELTMGKVALRFMPSSSRLGPELGPIQGPDDKASWASIRDKRMAQKC